MPHRTTYVGMVPPKLIHSNFSMVGFLFRKKLLERISIAWWMQLLKSLLLLEADYCAEVNNRQVRVHASVRNSCCAICENCEVLRRKEQQRGIGDERSSRNEKMNIPVGFQTLKKFVKRVLLHR